MVRKYPRSLFGVYGPIINLCPADRFANRYLSNILRACDFILCQVNGLRDLALLRHFQYETVVKIGFLNSCRSSQS